MKVKLFLTVMIPLVCIQIACVRPCRNALNRYGVFEHEFARIQEVFLAKDGSAGFVGEHTKFRWEPNYQKKQMEKKFLEKRPGYVIGSAANMQTLVRLTLYERAKKKTSDTSNVI